MRDEKDLLFESIEQGLSQEGFSIVEKNLRKPWGGYFVIEELQAQQFADKYFDGLSINDLKIGNKLSPKILVVAPHKRLSWQYHHRRAEIWQVVTGKVGISVSNTDIEGEIKVYGPKDQIKLKQGERHRLIGLEDWGVVAEIWQHTDVNHPSDEEDIIRLQDDFGR